MGFLTAAFFYKAFIVGLFFAFASPLVAFQESIDYWSYAAGGGTCGGLATSDGWQLVNITQDWMIGAIVLGLAGAALSVYGMLTLAKIGITSIASFIGFVLSVVAIVGAILEWNPIKSCVQPGY